MNGSLCHFAASARADFGIPAAAATSAPASRKSVSIWPSIVLAGASESLSLPRTGELPTEPLTPSSTKSFGLALSLAFSATGSSVTGEPAAPRRSGPASADRNVRSEEHTSELQLNRRAVQVTLAIKHPA